MKTKKAKALVKPAVKRGEVKKKMAAAAAFVGGRPNDRYPKKPK